ncbi:hypothetical protein [Chryseobacterium cucumeris]|uniref:hypothetical protein n=1 Tax=Chryseobacterium cucumeris TaxID=1813611 RepID=UPI001E428694|nr:hypothetical protein [Chryseobacterium cucumeris]
MALDNLISLSFTAEELTKLDQSLQTIETVLSGKTINLTPEERQQYGSIAEQNKLFVNKAKIYMEQYPQYVPNFLDKVEFDKDYQNSCLILKFCWIMITTIMPSPSIET